MRFGDRVEETTTTTGTGDITLNGATSGSLAFSDEIPEGMMTNYVIESGDDWEVAVGSRTGSTLSRTTVKSSNENNPLNLSGESTVFCAVPSSWFKSPTFSEYDLGSISGDVTIDPSNGTRQIGTMTDTTTITMDTPSSPMSVQLRLTGEFAINWNNVSWLGGSAPDFDGSSRVIILNYGSDGWIGDGGTY